MRSIRLAVLAILLSLCVSMPTAHAGPVPLPIGEAGLTVTIENEPTFRQGNPFAVSGYLYAVFALPIVVELAHGLPSQSIDILVDGARQATVTTTNDGHYQASFFLTEEQSTHTIQSVVFRGTPLEVRSPLRTVHADQVFTELTISPSTLALGLGGSNQLTAIALDGDGRPRDVTAQTLWSSSNAAVATVSGGNVTGHSPGDATITGAFSGLTGQVPVSVTDDGRG